MVIQQADKKIPDTEIIKIAVREFELHPKAEIKDYYKLFFQSFYGPGHLISDKESAFRFLKDELKDSHEFDEVLLQDIGNSFYRVNLKAVSAGIISLEDLFSAFIRSQQPEPLNAVWITVWDKIKSLLSRAPELRFSKKCDDLNLILKSNQIHISHSKIYKDCYHPHYRIVHKNNLTKALLNLI